MRTTTAVSRVSSLRSVIEATQRGYLDTEEEEMLQHCSTAALQDVCVCCCTLVTKESDG